MPERTLRYLEFDGDMGITMDRVQRDIQSVVENEALFLPLKGALFLVTGATGLIGAMLTRVLAAAEERYHLGMEIRAQIRDYDKAKRVLRDCLDRIKLTDLMEEDCTHLVHTV